MKKSEIVLTLETTRPAAGGRATVYEYETLTLPGWDPGVPGLGLARWNPGDKKVHEKWYLLQQPSGRFVRSFDKRADGQHFAALLGQSDVDWISAIPGDLDAAEAYLLALQTSKESA